MRSLRRRRYSYSHSFTSCRNPPHHGQAICDQLRAYLSTSPSVPDAASTDVITGLMRDLVGVSESCTTRRTYVAFFNWLHPDVMSMLPQVLPPLSCR
jgi:hypothetical protein